MAAHHYVSKFHLRGFCDPSSTPTPDPWLWVGDIEQSVVKRRSPKNIGTVADLYEGPGAFADSAVTIETFLANEVEAPAAKELRVFATSEFKSSDTLPPALMRYLAWAAARPLATQLLNIKWATEFGSLLTGPVVEPPPVGMSSTIDRHRPIRLLHAVTGKTIIVDTRDDSSELLDAGWIPDPSETANFLEGIHIQAYYFQSRWFPRLQWTTLRPPSGSYFIIGDRPVGWGTPDCLDAPPSCLRDPSAFLIAPLTHSLALVGRNNMKPWSVTPNQVNAILAAWSKKWVAGPTEQCVADALFDRDDAVIDSRILSAQDATGYDGH